MDIGGNINGILRSDFNRIGFFMIVYLIGNGLIRNTFDYNYWFFKYPITKFIFVFSLGIAVSYPVDNQKIKIILFFTVLILFIENYFDR